MIEPAIPPLFLPQESLALDRFARRARGLGVTPQGAVDFGGEARQGVEEHVAVEAIQHALALALAYHEAGALQHGEMARHGRRAEREAFREFGGGERGLRQESQNLPPGHGSKRAEDVVEVHGIKY